MVVVKLRQLGIQFRNEKLYKEVDALHFDFFFCWLLLLEINNNENLIKNLLFIMLFLFGVVYYVPVFHSLKHKYETDAKYLVTDMHKQK